MPVKMRSGLGLENTINVTKMRSGLGRSKQQIEKMYKLKKFNYIDSISVELINFTDE